MLTKPACARVTMSKALRSSYALIKQTVTEWMDLGVSRMGAALAFYTLFAVTPLFVITLAMAGLWFGEEAARRELFGQISGLVGSEGGEAIQALVSAARKPTTGAWATVIAVGTLFVGATGVFVQLQDSLNSIWGVRRKSGQGLRNFINDRLLSFALIVGIGFLLLVSLILSAGLAALGNFLTGVLPAQETLWQWINFGGSFGVITLLFAIIFKVLPDVKIAWRDVWIGAVLTALLFNLGKYLLGLYLGRSSVSSAYGAAGSLVIVLLWVYYSAQILFFGAKFTQIYSNRYGSHLQPAPGA
ncbi:MAG TPA: YihY/virulence factor BrkB family protein, partial [Verrucomicrobiae bacterium]|nr:YihY/virulence factor BrkB family protein [Verrucomicrobiae bacterium]